MASLSAHLSTRRRSPQPVWMGEVLTLGTSALCAGGVAFLAGSAVLLLGRDPVSRVASLQLAEMAGSMLAVGGTLRWFRPGDRPAG